MTCGPFDKQLLRATLGLRRVLAVCAAGVAALALAGCVATTSAQMAIDTSSPAAAETAEVVKSSGSFPRWSDFPKGPQPTPPPGDIAGRVAGLESSQAEVLKTAGGIAWTLSGTQTFAKAAHDRIDPDMAKPAPEDETAQAEAFAKQGRDLAAPPPPLINPK